MLYKLSEYSKIMSHPILIIFPDNIKKFIIIFELMMKIY